jgi:hypothetical protein
MTTLELARRMASAARRASSTDAAAVAVLNVLHDTSSWLTRVSEDADGLTVEVHYEQAELFATSRAGVSRGRARRSGRDEGGGSTAQAGAGATNDRGGT